MQQLLVGKAVARREIEDSLTGFADACSRTLVKLLLREFFGPVEREAHTANVSLGLRSRIGIIQAQTVESGIPKVDGTAEVLV